MKVWLDDQADDSDAPERWTPKGWVGVMSATAAMRLVRTGDVTVIDLDNDLGGELEGRHVLNLIEDLAQSGKIPRMEIRIHTSNSEARRIMELVRERCYRFWDSQDVDPEGHA
jgi:hypothetical protein